MAAAQGRRAPLGPGRAAGPVGAGQPGRPPHRLRLRVDAVPT